MRTAGSDRHSRADRRDESGDSETQGLTDRAATRGETAPSRITERMKRLPFLLQHEHLMTLGPTSDATLVEIVDDRWLPLITR